MRKLPKNVIGTQLSLWAGSVALETTIINFNNVGKIFSGGGGGGVGEGCNFPHEEEKRYPSAYFFQEAGVKLF